MTDGQYSYNELLELSQQELEQEARKILLYYNSILIVIGGNIAEQAYFEDLPMGENKDE